MDTGFSSTVSDLDWLYGFAPEEDEAIYSVSRTLYNSAEVHLSQRNFPCFGRAMCRLFQATPAGNHPFKGWDQFTLR